MKLISPLAVLLLLGQMTIARQADTAIMGVVTDTQGAIVTGADVTLRSTATRQEWHSVSDAAGRFIFAAVVDGGYTLRASASGFVTAEQRVTVAGQKVELTVTLTPGAAGESVNIQADSYVEKTASTATKLPTPLLTVPQAITVVNRQLLDDQGAVKLDDALKNVAGVKPGGYYQDWDYYRIRGFDASFTTYLDGLRGGSGMAEEIFGLERVEVVKGPSSSLYGQGVLGGLVNLESKRPHPDAFAKLEFTGGAFGMYAPAVDIGGSLNSSHTLYARLNALYRTQESFVDYVHKNRYYIAPALTWDIDRATSIIFLTRYQRDIDQLSFPLPAKGTVLPNVNGELPVSLFVGEPDTPNDIDEYNTQLGYEFTHRFSDGFILHQSLRYSVYKNTWDHILYPAFLGADDRTLFRYPYSYRSDTRNFQVDTGLESRLKTGSIVHTLYTGVDYYRSPNSFSYQTIDFSDPNAYMPIDIFHPVYGTPLPALQPWAGGKGLPQMFGVYAQDQMRLTERLSVTVGGRFDTASSKDDDGPTRRDNAFTPRVGANFEVLPGVVAYGSYSRSFQPQYGRTFDGTAGGAFIDPETGDQYEAGIKISLFGGRMTNMLSVYRLTRSNIGTTDPLHPSFLLVAGEQRSKGAELETSLHLMPGWNFTAAYTYLNAIVTRDNSIPIGTRTQNAPKSSISAWTSYEIQRGKVKGLGFGGGARYYSDQSGDLFDTFSLPSYGLADASVFYRHGHYRIQLNASNLFNQRYYAGSYNDIYVLPGEPRALRTTVSWTF